MHFIRQILFIRCQSLLVVFVICWWCYSMGMNLDMQLFVCPIIYTWKSWNAQFIFFSGFFPFFLSFEGLQSLWITTVCSSQLQQYKQERATNQPSIAYAQPIEKPPPTSVSSDKLLQTPTSSETGKKIYFLDNVIYLKKVAFWTFT